jgi:hypothetical protein
MNIDDIRDNIRVLEDDCVYLHKKMYGLEPDSLEWESVDRILMVKERLLAEQYALLEREESGSARWRAEKRLQHHIDNDTLDLY